MPVIRPFLNNLATIIEKQQKDRYLGTRHKLAAWGPLRGRRIDASRHDY